MPVFLSTMGSGTHTSCAALLADPPVTRFRSRNHRDPRRALRLLGGRQPFHETKPLATVCAPSFLSARFLNSVCNRRCRGRSRRLCCRRRGPRAHRRGRRRDRDARHGRRRARGPTAARRCEQARSAGRDDARGDCRRARPEGHAAAVACRRKSGPATRDLSAKTSCSSPLACPGQAERCAWTGSTIVLSGGQQLAAFHSMFRVLFRESEPVRVGEK
jgi:hypothetical protein